MAKTASNPNPAPAAAPAASMRPANPTTGRAIITAEGERALRAELARLRQEHATEFTQRLRDARDFGEGANNDELLQIREEEVVVAARIARLTNLLANATVVADGGGDPNVVAIGTIVRVDDLESEKSAEYVITGGHEPPTPNSASADSPVGRALVGNAPGTTVEVELPNGSVRRLRIAGVSHP